MEINHENFVRNINLYTLGGVELKEPYLSIYEMFEDNMKGMNKYTSKNIHLSNYIIYGNLPYEVSMEYVFKDENGLDNNQLWLNKDFYKKLIGTYEKSLSQETIIYLLGHFTHLYINKYNGLYLEVYQSLYIYHSDKLQDLNLQITEDKFHKYFTKTGTI